MVETKGVYDTDAYAKILISLLHVDVESNANCLFLFFSFKLLELLWPIEELKPILFCLYAGLKYAKILVIYVSMVETNKIQEVILK